MGNQLVGIAPSQIFPVEHYLTEHSDLKFDMSLGSTRFFKVARAQSQEGHIVVKVFAIHDPTLPLSTHKSKLEQLKSLLGDCANCLPFHRIILSEKAGFIMRQYIKYSLYDRISTRPFLSSIEKKWITFQILCAVSQAHRKKICHGDIKLENIMITSWNWVLLTDFASFKPTYLPEDNPADYTYFFDTSRRRTCYIAPERFVKTLTSEPNNALIFPEQELKTGDLQPAMDIFSTGCSLIELYNEGRPPFDFSQLLAYRCDEYSPQKHLDNIEDPAVKELLSSMIDKNPAKRKSAEEYVHEYRDKIFPGNFFEFLQPYMQIYSSPPILSPDEKITRLSNDIEYLSDKFKKEKEARQKSREMSEDEKNNEIEIKISAKDSKGNDNVKLSDQVKNDNHAKESDNKTKNEHNEEDSINKIEIKKDSKTESISSNEDELKSDNNNELKSMYSKINEEQSEEAKNNKDKMETSNKVGEKSSSRCEIESIRGEKKCTNTNKETSNEKENNKSEITNQKITSKEGEKKVDNNKSLGKNESNSLKMESLKSSIDEISNVNNLKKSKYHSALSDDDEFILLTQLVTSCIRGLHHSQSKLDSFEILYEIAKNTSDETILDRIIPFIFSLILDTEPRVRVSAIHTLTHCLYLVKSVPPSDVNVFPEYILPGLAHLVQDSKVIVRAAIAEKIGDLAYLALRFLDITYPLTKEDNDTPKTSYENELQTLHEMVQQSVSSLLTDRSNLVKQTLIENSISKLCEFFGKQKANDILLGHIITFLNDKEDRHLRESFFKCIIEIAAYVGWHCSPILMPLLQQGLTDPEEFVIAKAINAMGTLTSLELLHKSALYQLLMETVGFLIHPNLWIRHATVGFISKTARSLNVVDVQCKVLPIVQPYLKHPLIQLEKEVLLLEALVPPMPHALFELVTKFKDQDEVFNFFEERKIARLKGVVPQHNDMSPALKILARRLSSESVSETAEEHLLVLKPHLMKYSKYRQALDAKKSETETNGRLELGAIKKDLSLHVAILYPDSKSDIGLSSFRKLDRRTSDSTTTYAAMNQEWRAMFAAQENIQNSGVKLSDLSGSGGSPGQSTHSCDIHMSPQHSFTDALTINDHSLHERSYIQYRLASCRVELRQLTCRKQEQHAATIRAQHWADNMAWSNGSRLLPNGWRPRGNLIAYLHEHRAAINRLVALPDSSTLFASSSSDGCIKIWDVSKMEGRNIANRSKQTYMQKGGPLVGLVVCDQGQSLASSSQSGSVFVVRMDPGSSKMTALCDRQLDLQEEGCAVDLQYLDSGSQSVLVYASLYGSLVGWDLRCPGTAWRLENDLKYGVITSFCVNNHQQWLTLGTSSGVHICWDLRFQLPISNIKHPTGARVRKVLTHPTENAWIISSVQGNNEISMWNLETGFRQMVLWASSAPPLSHSQGGHSVYAMHAATVDRNAFLLASGTDMRLRFWNLASPTESHVVLPAANDALISSSPITLAYEQRLIDGTNVVQEVLAPNPNTTPGSGGSSSQRGRVVEEGGPGPEMPHPGHHDTISAVAMCNTHILTGSTDGLIQVWK